MSRLIGAGFVLVVLAAATACGDDDPVPESRAAQDSAAPPSAVASARPSVPVPPSSEPGQVLRAEEVLAFAGLNVPAPIQASATAVAVPGGLPAYRVTLSGDRAVLDAVCSQMGGALRTAVDLRPGELQELGLTVQPPKGSPIRESSRRDYRRIQRKVIALPEGPGLNITVYVVEYPVR